MGFHEFLSTAVSSPQLLITVLLTLGVIFVNGWTDAPNAIATCITTRCLKVRTAIIMVMGVMPSTENMVMLESMDIAMDTKRMKNKKSLVYGQH